MEKRVLCVEQHLRRGVNTNALIAAYLENAGNKARLSLTGTQLCNNLIQFEPHVVYYPWLTESVLRFLRRREASVPIVNAFQEQNSVLHSPDSYMVRWAGKADYLFAWGNIQKNRFEELFDDTTVYLTGNPRFDPYFDKSIADALYPTREELAKQYALPSKKKWVLMALDFPLVFSSDERIEELVQANDLSREKVNTIREIYWELSTWVRNYNGCDEDLILIIRPHPGSNIERIRKDFGGESEVTRFIRGGELPPWIIAADRYVSRASTSIIESWITNTPSALIKKNKSVNNGDDRPHILETDVSIESYSEFKSFVEDNSDDNALNKHYTFLDSHYELDGKSAYRSAKRLNEISARQKSKNYDSRYAEDTLECVKYTIKFILSEYGLGEWNPLNRPSDKFLSKKESRKRIKSIKSRLNL